MFLNLRDIEVSGILARVLTLSYQNKILAKVLKV